MKVVYLIIAVLGIILTVQLAKAVTIGDSHVKGVVINIPGEPLLNNNSINVNNSNCWQGDCGGFRNPFDQSLNTTNNVNFANITLTNASKIKAGDPTLYGIDNSTTIFLTANHPSNAFGFGRGSSTITRLLWSHFGGSIAVSTITVGGNNAITFVGANSGRYGAGDVVLGTVNTSQTLFADVSNRTVAIGPHVDLPTVATLDVNGTGYFYDRLTVNSTVNALYLAGDGSQITNLSIGALPFLRNDTASRKNGSMTVDITAIGDDPLIITFNNVPIFQLTTDFLGSGLFGIQALSNMGACFANDDFFARGCFTDAGVIDLVGFGGINGYTGLADQGHSQLPGVNVNYVRGEFRQGLNSTEVNVTQANINFVNNPGNVTNADTIFARNVNTTTLYVQNITSNFTTESFVPRGHKVQDIGTNVSKYANAYIFNVHTGDITFENGIVLKECGSDMCFYNATGAMKSRIGADGTFMLNTTGSKPTCNVANRGKSWITFGGPGVADMQEICLKNNQDQYGWVAATSTGVITP